MTFTNVGAFSSRYYVERREIHTYIHTYAAFCHKFTGGTVKVYLFDHPGCMKLLNTTWLWISDWDILFAACLTMLSAANIG